MKRSKTLIAAVAAIVIAVALIASACVVEDTQIDDAFKLAAKGDYLKVEVSDENGIFYIYDNGKVTDVYGLGIRFEDVAGEKGEAFAFTTANLKEGYKCDNDKESGKVSLKAELVNTQALGNIDGATVVLEANTVTNEVFTYTVSYTDENGYKVKITLAE